MFLYFVLCFGPVAFQVSLTEDLLHVFHQGVACILIPALICHHLECKHPGIKLKQMDRLLSTEVYAHYKSWCRDRAPYVSTTSHRFSALRFGKESWKMFPTLSSVYKAAMVKSMIFWCAAYLKECEVDNSMGQLRKRTMHAFATFQLLLDVKPDWLDYGDKMKMVSYARQGLLLYQQLAAYDRQRRDQRKNYKITPKFHSFFELTFYIEETSRNPRYLAICYRPIFFTNMLVDICWYIFGKILWLIPGLNTAIKMRT